MGGEENGEERRKTTTASSANPLAPGKQLKSASALNPKQPFSHNGRLGGILKKIIFYISLFTSSNSLRKIFIRSQNIQDKRS